ncbi:sugar phosphate nucleotidyltransferase [Candidatus Bathyarchaeota archaeon]|nr:sugar phosphate nucleotidyltransferase [Candidatus Bathyarchaeota archaeon]
MHELVDEDQTEPILKKKYKIIGEHLYIKPNSKLDTSSVTKSDLRNIQISFLMGGGGTRLVHVTKDEISKHMININNKPLSKHTFDLWSSNGFNKFCMLIDNTHRAKSIKDYYGDGSRFSTSIAYSVEYQKLGSGGGIKNAIENGAIEDSFVNHFPDDQVVNYEHFPRDFARVFVAAMRAGYDVVVVCVPGKLYPYGEVLDIDGRVVDFVEKPFVKKDTNTGIFGISRRVFPLIEALESGKEVKIERTVLKKVARSGKMFKVLMPTEYWIPVNDEPNLKKFIEISEKTEADKPLGALATAIQ